ncbi:MAG: DUF3124 domain-containing protein [Haliscomenobacter sp.]|nr:DUF3124 domain-containing protein [Haliscomenobacter sp.]
MKKWSLWMAMLGSLVLTFCEKAPEQQRTAHSPSRKYSYSEEEIDSFPFRERIYVPIYSDIYHMSGENRFLLTATLSLRNTSPTDSVFVGRVHYYDSHGALIRKYLEKAIVLAPLEAAEFVVEQKEKKGGAGASFLLEWGARRPVSRPVFQAIMIGTAHSQGISFTTEGVVVESNLDASPR